jgi:SH3-like domain-containing protein
MKNSGGGEALTRVAMALVCVLAGGLAAMGPRAAAQPAGVDLAARKTGQVSGLPLPRFVSLKADEVNVRRGPGWDHAVAWVFRRAGLPVEVIAEFDVWRQVRDSEGATGWVLGSLLSGRRTVLAAPWLEKGNLIELHAAASKSSQVAARLTPGVLGDVDECDGSWCGITAGGVSGYIAQELVWGAYPEERID